MDNNNNKYNMREVFAACYLRRQYTAIFQWNFEKPGFSHGKSI